MDIQGSGHPVVDKLYALEQSGKIELVGNLIPSAWRHTLLDERGRPHYLAADVLSEIVYRHRTTAQRDKQTGQSCLGKRFKADLYQINRGELANKFNVSKDAISAALGFLEDVKVIQREYRDPIICERGYRKVVFIHLYLERLVELCRMPKDADAKASSQRAAQATAGNLDQAGYVGGMKGATSPGSSGQCSTLDDGNVAHVMPVLSEIPSATPSKENNNNNNTQRAASRHDAAGAAAGDGDESPSETAGLCPEPHQGGSPLGTPVSVGIMALAPTAHIARKQDSSTAQNQHGNNQQRKEGSDSSGSQNSSRSKPPGQTQLARVVEAGDFVCLCFCPIQGRKQKRRENADDCDYD